MERPVVASYGQLGVAGRLSLAHRHSLSHWQVQTHWSGSAVVQPCPAILVGYLQRQFISGVHNRWPPPTAAADGRCRRPLPPASLSGWSPATHAHSYTPAHRTIFTAGNPRIRAGGIKSYASDCIPFGCTCGGGPYTTWAGTEVAVPDGRLKGLAEVAAPSCARGTGG
jgi:hypothetical protein